MKLLYAHMKGLIMDDETEIIEVATEMTGPQLIISTIKRWFYWNVSRRLPRLVWVDQEIDINIRFSEDPLTPDAPIQGLFSGTLADVEKQLSDIGIGFDRGQGEDGRDWQWDWSLSGPISVTFKSVATKPEIRKPRKPKLRIVT